MALRLPLGLAAPLGEAVAAHWLAVPVPQRVPVPLTVLEILGEGLKERALEQGRSASSKARR